MLRGEGKGREREEEKHQSVASHASPTRAEPKTQACALMGNQTVYRMVLQPTEPQLARGNSWGF